MKPSSLWKNATTLHGLALAVGVVAGGAAVLFEHLVQFVSWLILYEGIGYAPGGPANETRLYASGSTGPLLLLGLLVAPAVGGGLSAMLCRWLAPEASGAGTDAVVDAYHARRGRIRARVPVVKAFATAISLGTGGSGGREGPIAQIGAGVASWLAALLNLGARQRRILLAAGMGQWR